MASSVSVNGQNTRQPGVYAMPNASALGGTAAGIGRLAVLGDFPWLEQAMPIVKTTASSLKRLNPANDELQLVTHLIYNAAADDRIGQPSAVILCNVQPTTQAKATLNDAAAAGAVTLSAALWGTDGNRTSYAVVAGTSKGVKITLARDGLSEVFDNVTYDNILGFDYTGSDATTMLLSFATVSGVKRLRLSYTKTGINGASTFTPADLPVDGTITITPSVAVTGTATVSGINKATGVADTEVRTFTASAVAQTTTKAWSSLTSIVFTHDAAQTYTISGYSFDLGADVYPWASNLTDRVAAATGFTTSAAASPRASAIPTSELDDKTSTGATVANILSADGPFSFYGISSPATIVLRADDDAGTDVTTSIAYAGSSHTGAAATYAAANTKVLAIKVNGVTYSKTATAAESDQASWLAWFNDGTKFPGLSAVNAGGQFKIQSDDKGSGPMATFQILAGGAGSDAETIASLGLTAAVYSGSGDVASYLAVTAAELAPLVSAAIVAAVQTTKMTVTTAGNKLSASSVTTGTTGKIQCRSTSTLDTPLGADFAANTDDAGAAATTVSIHGATAYLLADNYAVVQTLGNSTLVTAERATSATAPPTTGLSGYLSGGTTTSTSDGDWTTALTALRNRTWDVEILCGMTSTASQHALIRSHCQYMAGVGANECIGWSAAGPLETLSQLQTRVTNLNTRHVSPPVFESIVTTDHLGVQRTLDPKYAALRYAAMEAGTATAPTPLTWKRPNFLSTVVNSGIDVDQDAEDLLAAHLFFSNHDRLGLRIVRGLTSYATDDNPIWSERSTVRGLNASIKDLRGYLEAVIGDPAVAATANRIKTICKSRLDTQIKNGTIKAYDAASLTVEDLGDTFRVSYLVALVEPTNFVLVEPYITRIAQNA